jgi:hypothetical protein
MTGLAQTADFQAYQKSGGIIQPRGGQSETPSSAFALRQHTKTLTPCTMLEVRAKGRWTPSI